MNTNRPAGSPDRGPGSSIRPVPQELVADLRRLLELRLLAKALYAHLTWWYPGARPFAELRGIERRRANDLVSLLQRVGVADSKEAGELDCCSDPTMERAFDRWCALGEVSWSQAVTAAIDMEERRIEHGGRLLPRQACAELSTGYESLIDDAHHHRDVLTRTRRRVDGASHGDGVGAAKPAGGPRRGRRRVRPVADVRGGGARSAAGPADAEEVAS